MNCALFVFLLIPLFAAGTADGATPSATPEALTNVNQIAEAYVKLVLAIGQHDPDYVDAYYGPPEWKKQSHGKRPLDAIAHEATRLRDQLAQISKPTDEMERLRREYLTKQLSALEARVRMLNGEHLKFDEESQALYDAVAPAFPETHFQEILARLEPKLPGEGSLLQRYENWRRAFVIPKAKLDMVFQLAIKACRERTLAHIILPSNENFSIEYVTNEPWGGYNWYKGHYRSVIQVNTDLPVYIDRAIDLAAHEGYPGHHVYNALLEKNLVRDRGWVEFSVCPLFSPQSLIAEGTANFGREVVFTETERLAFEKEVLWPAAGIDPSRAEEFYAVQGLVKKLAYATNEAARQYLNGEIDPKGAATWLQKYALMDEKRAKQGVKFIEKYRSYVINYNLGEDMVRSYIEKRGGTEQQPQKRWREFEQLLASPRLPGDIRQGQPPITILAKPKFLAHAERRPKFLKPMATYPTQYAHPEALVETDWLEKHLNDEGIRIVESNEDILLYDTGHIPGAVHIDWRADLQDPVIRDYISPEKFARLCSRHGITPDTICIFYGDKANWWACYALWAFRLFGHDKVKILNGGRDKWKAEGRRMTREIPKFAETNYPVPKQRFDKEIRAFFDEALAQSKSGKPLVDVRSPGEYRGEITHMPEYPQEGVLRGGHIPRAKSMPWKTATNDDSTFKPADELAKIYFDQCDLKPGTDTVVYCRIGERSSHTWFVLTYLLGLANVRNYDGSWTEWGNKVGAPIEKSA